MKRSIALTSLLLLLSVSTLFAATNVPSILSGDVHWDQAGSPYLLQGHVTVPVGAHLTIDPAVQVVFQGAAVLEVNGNLEANGSAAGPAVFNLQEGGLQSEIFINGGEAHFTNVKILSGVFLAKDAKLTMDGADVTKGSGIYLQGSTVAHLKNNKIYGNSTGVVLDGQVMANLQFNTLVQNTYGLYVKSLSQLTFQYNSIHDNQMEVVSMIPVMKLGGNYWGTNDSKNLKPKIQGKVSLSPMRTLKDVLRVYVRTQLPVITQQMALALATREKKEAKDEAAALKKFRQQQATAAKAPAAPAVPAVPAPSAGMNPPVPSASEAAVPPSPGVPPIPSMGETAPPPTAAGTAAAPPVPALPEAGGGMPPVPSTTEASASPAAPAPPVPGGNEGIPSPPDLAEQVPPPSPASTTTSSPTASSSVQAPPPVPGSEMPGAPAPPPEVAGTTAVTAPAPPSTSSAAPPAAPPVPEAPAVASVPSAPPPVTEAEKPIPTPIPPAEPTAAQLKVVNELKGVNGDIDGMQAPPLETSSGLETGTGSKSNKKAPNVSNLDLPPLKDSEILPPKDLDLPPTEDLGNINLNSPSK